MRIAGPVLSTQEKIVARMRADDPTLRTRENPEYPVERRIVTLVKRVTYKTTTRPKLNRCYGLLYGLNSLSQINWQSQICEQMLWGSFAFAGLVRGAA